MSAHQDDIFKTVKANVEIVTYIEAEVGQQAKKVGSDTYRISPCPLCGHNDCFTLYPKDNSWHCFSCDRSGTVIDFELHHKGLKEPLEAARSVARKRGIALDQQSVPPQSKKSKSKATHTPNSKSKARPGIDNDRANALRQLVAAFYHEQLLNDSKALEYQTKERGHSLEVLKTFRVGYAGRESIIKYARKKGYKVEDLIGVGLARKWGRGYSATIPQGAFIYPQEVNGNIAYFSIKVFHGKKPFQVKKQYAGQGWLCWNQDVLGKSIGPIIICEGENDLLSLVGKAKQPDVICTIGNFNVSNILSFLQKNSKGRSFYLCFDRDEAGQKYTEKYAAAILAGGSQVRVIEIPEPHKDIDEFLCASEDPWGDFKRLMEEAKVIEKAAQVQGGEAGSDLYDFDAFKVEGESRDGKLVFGSRVNRKIYIVTLREFSLDQLCQIGGEQVSQRVALRDARPGQVLFRALKKRLIVQASRTQLGELQWVGQGVSLLRDNSLLIVNGEEVYVWDGMRFKSYESSLIEGKLIERNSGRRWINFEAVKKKVMSMTKSQAFEIIKEAHELFEQWGFSSGWDTALVTGFMFAQMVQTAWNWRPHLWISGPQASGKTLLLEFLEAIGGNLSMRREGQTLTEAGIRQDIGNDFPLCYIDEAEMPIPVKSATHSMRSRPPNPEEVGHLIQ